MKEIHIIDAPTLRNGVAMVQGTITADVLTSKSAVPQREYNDQKGRTGYQQPLAMARVNRLISDLVEHRVDLPTAVLLNLREYDPDEDIKARNGMKFFYPRSPLYVVDGQHRVAALKKLVGKKNSKWNDFPIPFLCMLGATEQQELEQFYVVNSTAKSVKTDLAYDLLKTMAETDAGLLTSLEETGEAWKVKAQTIVEQLADKSPIWKHRVRFSGDEKADTIISNSGLASSLKHLLDTPLFGRHTTDGQLKILDVYWRAIARLLPEAFEYPQKQEYALQKSTPGAWVMHELLIDILENIRNTGNSMLEIESYTELLEPVFSQLSGDTSNGDLVSGLDFWKSGAAGAAGVFSGHGGRRVLLAKMKIELPSIDVG